VTCTDIHQRPEDTTVKESPGFLEGRVKAMVKTNFDDTVSVLGRLHQRAQFDGVTCRRLFHQHMFTVCDSSLGNWRETIIRRSDDNQVNIITLDDRAPCRTGATVWELRREMLRTGQMRIGYDHQLTVR